MVTYYEFRPAGHNLKMERKDYIKTESKLYKVFEKWLYEFDYKEWNYLIYSDESYNKAVKMIKDIKPTIYEAHSALIAYQDHPKIKYAGLFVSAVYNLVQDKTIVFDVNLDVDINCLGYRLEKGKILVNRSKVGGWMGFQASGIVVNYGEVGEAMGSRSSGIVVNYGKAGEGMGYEASGIVVNYGRAEESMGLGTLGILVNYGKAGDWMGEGASGVVINYGEVGKRMGVWTSGVVINYGKAGDWMGDLASGVVINYGKAGDFMGLAASGKIIAIKNPKSFGYFKDAELVLNEEECRRIPGLIEYFDELKAKLYEARNNPELLLKVFSDNPADKIKKDVDELIRRSGYWRR
jgi:hypothetical protein